MYFVLCSIDVANFRDYDGVFLSDQAMTVEPSQLGVEYGLTLKA
jgi:hypothetical protein